MKAICNELPSFAYLHQPSPTVEFADDDTLKEDKNTRGKK